MEIGTDMNPNLQVSASKETLAAESAYADRLLGATSAGMIGGTAGAVIGSALGLAGGVLAIGPAGAFIGLVGGITYRIIKDRKLSDQG